MVKAVSVGTRLRKDEFRVGEEVCDAREEGCETVGYLLMS